MENNMIDFTGTINNTNDSSEGIPAMDYSITNTAENPMQFTGKLRKVTQALRNNNIEAPEFLLRDLPASPVAASQTILKLAPEASENHLQAAAEAVLNGEDPTEHMHRFAAWRGVNDLATEVFEASRARYIETLETHADELTEQVRRTIFTPALRKLKTLVKNHPGKQWNLDIAIKSKDYAHASIIDQNQHIAEQLHKAYTIRALFYTSEAFTSPAATITTPGYKGKIQTDNLQWWIQTLSNGHTPHLPTANEWHQLHYSKEHANHREAEAKRNAALNAQDNNGPVIQTLMHDAR